MLGAIGVLCHAGEITLDVAGNRRCKAKISLKAVGGDEMSGGRLVETRRMQKGKKGKNELDGKARSCRIVDFNCGKIDYAYDGQLIVTLAYQPQLSPSRQQFRLYNGIASAG